MLTILISSHESEEFEEPSPAPAQPLIKEDAPAFKMEFDVDEAFKVWFQFSQLSDDSSVFY